MVIAEQPAPIDAGRESAAGELDGGEFPNVRLCGNARCVDFDIELSGMQIPTFACCSDAKRSACGAAIFGKCVELHHAGRPESTCPPLPGSIIGVPTLQGCCQPEGACGVIDPKYGFGCAQIPYVSQLVPACTY